MTEIRYRLRVEERHSYKLLVIYDAEKDKEYSNDPESTISIVGSLRLDSAEEIDRWMKAVEILNNDIGKDSLEKLIALQVLPIKEQKPLSLS